MTAPPPLFSVPMPWLHVLPRAVPLDCDSVAGLIADHLEVPLAAGLQPFVKAVADTNLWLSRPPDPLDPNDTPAVRRGVIQWAWGEQLNAPLNNSIRSMIPALFLPLIILDVLLHVSKPDPALLLRRSPSCIQHENFM
ncbi:hypothetical protein C8R45DRAFT_972017 [Mycena sanguinolenta]|nr:hypothetical protein C8R45DRAFT_972017 [Mycena sanguinolenta]